MQPLTVMAHTFLFWEKANKKPKGKHWGNVKVVCMKQCGTRGSRAASSHSKHLDFQRERTSRQKKQTAFQDTEF